jgi:hypothetical protein
VGSVARSGGEDDFGLGLCGRRSRCLPIFHARPPTAARPRDSECVDDPLTLPFTARTPALPVTRARQPCN